MVQIVYQFCFNLCSYSAYILFDNKLELVICKLRVETFKVFYTLFEHSPLNLPPPKLTFLPMLCFPSQGLPHCMPATFSQHSLFLSNDSASKSSTTQTHFPPYAMLSQPRSTTLHTCNIFARYCQKCHPSCWLYEWVCPSLLVKGEKGQQSSGICFGCMQQDPLDKGARQVNLCFWVQAPYTIPPIAFPCLLL